jgi:phage gp29-like protein
MLEVANRVGRPRVAYNPAGYKRAKRAWESGDARPLIAMMREASFDSHITGCLIGRRAGYKRQYTLVPHDDTEPARERRDWFEQTLTRLNVRELLEMIHEARLYFYNVIDFEWSVEDGRQVPTALTDFPQHKFTRDGDDDGELKIDFQGELREIPDTALVVEERRTPVMMPPLTDWILQEFGWEAWAHFMETFGADFILGKYPPGSGDDFKDELEEGVESMAAASRGIAPHGSDVEVFGSDRTTGDHQAFTERTEERQAVALLGHKNAVKDAGNVNVGGQQTSYEVRFDLARDDMFWIEPHVNQLIKLIGDRNFGDGDYPNFELNKRKPVDPQKYTDICHTWWKMGFKVDPSEAERVGLQRAPDQEPMQKPPSEINRFPMD